MIQWLIHILVDALVLLVAAKFMTSVEVRNFSTAVIVAIVIGILSFLIGWLLTLILNIATIGIFYFLGLGFVTRIVANAIVIEITDQMSRGFNTRGFMPSLILAVIIAFVGSIVDAILF
jgi:putative membrane protein